MKHFLSRNYIRRSNVVIAFISTLLIFVWPLVSGDPLYVFNPAVFALALLLTVVVLTAFSALDDMIRSRNDD